MSKHKLRDHVIEELDYDPRVSSKYIGVTVDEHTVTLTGHVSELSRKTRCS